MKVELLDYMGSDLDVVNAARVSFDKESEWETEVVGREKDRFGDTEFIFGNPHLSDKDTKLIRYLAKHGHWTPFSHCYAKFRIKAPLFVRTQLFKHKVGLTENEVSRRYVDSEPEFYVPETWRKRAANVKQGSSDEGISYTKVLDVDGNNSPIVDAYDTFISEAISFYKRLISKGVCPEQARMVLPQSMITEFIWSGSLSAFARVYMQRTSEHAQLETKRVALSIGETLSSLFPVSWKALTNETPDPTPCSDPDTYYGC